ncbi:MAG TPA: peptidoglycan DD-metalloendopeptidase family protein [Alphaproteobacteria bacterium]|nr:peptidoglycan DD-metalloendopeptidase family protein [Alphaproteobacteria bacterium]
MTSQVEKYRDFYRNMWVIGQHIQRLCMFWAARILPGLSIGLLSIPFLVPLANSQTNPNLALAEMEKIRQELIVVSKQAQQQQQTLADLEQKREELEETEKAKIQTLANQQQEIGGLILILVRISSSPPEALAFSQNSIIDIVRTAILVETTIQQLHQRSVALQKELGSLQQIRLQITNQHLQINQSAQNFALVEQKLSALLAQRQQWNNLPSSDRQNFIDRVNKLTQDAKDLRELLAKFSELPLAPDLTVAIDIETLQPSPNPQPNSSVSVITLRLEKPKNFQNFPTRSSTLTPPVQGKIVGFFNKTYDTTEILRGLFIETNNSAPVLAPFDGQIKFRGQFRSYGEILIIEHGRGYHTVIGGLGKIDAEIGQWFLAGEPIGVMANTPGKKPRLYFELRQQGQPIDPLPWLNFLRRE